MSIAVGFVGTRLTEARRARGITASDLASMIELSVQSLSKYENGHQMPRLEIVDRMATTLGFPRQYFFRPHRHVDNLPVFWRSKLSAQVTDLDRAAVRLEWLKEVVDYLGGFFNFPALALTGSTCRQSRRHYAGLYRGCRYLSSGRVGCSPWAAARRAGEGRGERNPGLAHPRPR